MGESEKVKVLLEKLIYETENSRIGTSEELIQALVNGLSFVKRPEWEASAKESL